MAVDQRLTPVPGKKPAIASSGWQPPPPARKPGDGNFAAAVQLASAPVPSRKPVGGKMETTPSGTAVPAGGAAARPGGEPVVDAIRSVAGLSGHGFVSLMSQAQQESGLDTKARNRKSSATGPFQFIERTWLDLVRRHGSAYGLGDMAQKIKVVDGAPTVGDAATRKKILALREDPNLSAGMAARYLGEGKERLGKMLGRPASTIESRIAYVMGPSGAARLINAAEKTPKAIARDLLPSAAAANKNLFHDRSGHALTASDMLNRLTRRMAADERRFAELEGDTPGAQPTPAHSNALLFAQMGEDGRPDGQPEGDADADEAEGGMMVPPLPRDRHHG